MRHRSFFALALALLVSLWGRAPAPTEAPDPIESEVVLRVVDAPDRARMLGAPGVIRDRVDLAAFLSRHGLGPVTDELASHLDDGRALLGAELLGNCQAPIGAGVVVDGAAVTLGPVLAPQDPDVDCARLVPATMLVAVDPDELPADPIINGGTADAPAGGGVVVALRQVDYEAGVAARAIGDDAELVEFLATVAGAPATLDLAAPIDGTTRWAYVVPTCRPSTGEVIVDEDGLVSVQLQQTGDVRIACARAEMYLVIVDIANELLDAD